MLQGTLASKLAALGAFVLMGASPSFMDWQQSPGKRIQIIMFYAVAIALFWFGFVK